ncbi:MAG TPA: alpha/beta hydrolase [Burkholderiaceae bacterium]|jgi:predicted alpha/beta hydrolase family esterase|nr:alpha/beta hydrolase [Burkholderiaceae bacterium]
MEPQSTFFPVFPSFRNLMRDEMQQHNISAQRVLIVPGLHGSDYAHWQSRWQRLYPSFERVDQDDPHAPNLNVWCERFQEVLRRSAQPTIAVAHSFGCLATVRAAAQGAPNLIGMLLVAPADPEKFDLTSAMQTGPLAQPALLVGSRNDPWMASERARIWAEIWGVDFLCAGELGHINAESGIGDWPFGLSLLSKVVEAARIQYAKIA